jgi:thiamine monophosphate synthase
MIAPAGFLIGQSVHSPAEAAVAGESADYVIFGTVFETLSKPGQAAAGCTALHDAIRATTAPVLAVGGVNVDNAAEVARAGAAGVAAIGLFASASVETVLAVDRIVRAFDLPVTGS